MRVLFAYIAGISKKTSKERRSSWLGIVNLFQSFEDLESVKDKPSYIQAVREVLNEADNDVIVPLPQSPTQTPHQHNQ